MEKTKYIGKDMSRVDGVAKVTGAAKYAVEFQTPNVAHGFIVQSTIARGKITSIDTAEAAKQTGVLRVFTHNNMLKSKAKNSEFAALQSDEIKFYGQPVALVVAETFEQARFAARLVKVEYAPEKPRTRIADVAPTETRFAKPRGNPKAEFDASPVKVEAEYTIPIEHHNPMEMHGCIAAWEGDKLTLFNKTQGVKDCQDALAKSFGVANDKVRVVSPFVGGAFGSALNLHYYPFIAAAAAGDLKRPVKLSYTRRQMFTGHGYRPFTWQKIAIGAEKNGKLRSIIQEAIGNTSTFEDFSENPNDYGRALYACPNYDTPYRLAKLDLPTPTWMRAPGAVSGAFALESALDELAYKLKIDPLEIRLINYAETDPESGKPFSSKSLRECYAEGAKKFGWSKRNPEPRSMRDGKWLVGWGMASGTWGAWQLPATVRIKLSADGSAHVGSATSDIGPGTYTVITMIAAEYLGIAPENVKFDLGDTDLPDAPVQGGSFTTASVGSAAYGAAMKIKEKLVGVAVPGAKADDFDLTEGFLVSKTDASQRFPIIDVMKSKGLAEIDETFTGMPSGERNKYETRAHGAQFVEVKVDEDFGIVKVTRVVETTAVGRIMNPKTSHSQEMGGVVMGIGMALQEVTEIDHRYGKMMTTDLASYHFPVNADIHSIDTTFIEEDDKIVNPLGIKGMGELCLVGIPAAIANAVFHATGKRIRELPITPEKLIG